MKESEKFLGNFQNKLPEKLFEKMPEEFLKAKQVEYEKSEIRQETVTFFSSDSSGFRKTSIVNF